MSPFKIKLTFKGLQNRFNLYNIMVKKTFLFDIYSLKKYLFSVLFVSIVPIIFISFYPSQNLDSSSSLNEILGMTQIIFSYCVALATIMIYSSASLIADEFKQNTIILLITKPITKGTIIWGKYLALLLFGILLCILSLGILCLFAFIKYPFSDIGEFFTTQLTYSMIIVFFYGTLTTGFSMIFRNSKMATIVPLTFTMITIFLFFIIKPLLMNPTPLGISYYEIYQIFYFDLGYHFMNIYTWMYELYISPLSTTLIRWLVSWSIYTIEYDPLFPEIEIYTKTNFLPPQASLLIITLFATVIIIMSYLIFRKRDIT